MDLALVSDSIDWSVLFHCGIKIRLLQLSTDDQAFHKLSVEANFVYRCQVSNVKDLSMTIV